jgi:hypothetical protein
MAQGKAKWAIVRFSFAENKPRRTVSSTSGWTAVALYSPTSDDNALQKGRSVPPKMIGLVICHTYLDVSLRYNLNFWGYKKTRNIRRVNDQTSSCHRYRKVIKILYLERDYSAGAVAAYLKKRGVEEAT